MAKKKPVSKATKKAAKKYTIPQSKNPRHHTVPPRGVPDEDGFEDISSNIFKFTETGDVLTGMLDGFHDITTDNGDCKAYYLVTSTHGRVSFIGGYLVDQAIAKHDIVNGDIVKITFHGKKDIGNGRTLNDFDIKVKKDLSLR